MNELLETIFAEVHGAWRFRWHGLAVAWIVSVLGWVGVMLLPNKYEAHAQIYVDTTSVLKPLLQGIAVSPSAQDESDVVRRVLLARPTLERVAAMTGANRYAKTPEEKEVVLKSLSDRIAIQADTRYSIYSIFFRDTNPLVARDVVQSLLDSFVRDSLGRGHANTKNAQEFLQAQVVEYAGRLAASEQRLAEFKKRHVGLMPDQRGDYFQRMQAEVAALEHKRGELAVAERQRDEVRRKILADAPDGAPLPVAPSDKQIQTATELDRRIQETRRQLDELLLKYTDRHPDVIALRDTLARLELRRDTEVGAIRRTNPTTAHDGSTGVDEVLQSLQIRLNNADFEVAALQTQVAQGAARVDELRRLVSSGPEIEAELADLNRDYGVTKTQYEQLLQRLESAKISQDADSSQEINYKLLEAPRLPLEPVSPKRIPMLVLAVLAGLVAGAGAAYVLSQANPVFITPRSVMKVTGLPVVGAVSRILSDADRATRKRVNWYYASAMGSLAAALVVEILVRKVGSDALRTALGLH